MGQIAYRANLSAATFPMTLADGGRTVIIPGPDQNFDRRVDPTGEQRDAGIPQALYLENVIPTVNGYQSVGYIASNKTLPPDPILYKIETVLSGSLSPATIYFTSAGTLFTGPAASRAISVVGGIITSSARITVAAVNGVSYLFDAAGNELYEFAEIAGVPTLTSVSASVLPAGFLSSIETICASNNYLLAADSNRVYYSSLTTPTDFTASLVSGAGSIVPNDLSGRIKLMKPAPGGFYVYADNNAVYSQYTGNARYPWKFTPVKNFVGLVDAPFTEIALLQTLVYGAADIAEQYVVEKTNQIKVIRGSEARNILADLDDFLGRTNVQATLDYSNNTFTEQKLRTLLPKLYFLDSRYLLVSVCDSVTDTGSPSNSRYILVIDVNLNRVGKLKITHKTVSSEFVLVVGSSLLKPLLLVLTDAGTFKYVQFDIYNTLSVSNIGTYEASQGALLLGKFQYVRSRMMQLEEIEIEGPQNTAIVPSPNFSVALLPSQDGRNFNSSVSLSDPTISGGLATYTCHHTAKNHSILIKGAFSINTLQLKFVPGGER